MRQALFLCFCLFVNLCSSAAVINGTQLQSSNTWYEFTGTGSHQDPIRFNGSTLAIPAQPVVTPTPISNVDEDPLTNALAYISNEYGHSIDSFGDRTLFRTCGRSTNIDTTRSTIGQFNGSVKNEVFQDKNSINEIITNQARYKGTVVLEGYVIEGGGLNYIKQRVILNGHKRVLLERPLARVTKLYFANGEAGLKEGSGNKIFVFRGKGTTTTQGVPNFDPKIHLILEEGFNNSQKLSFSVANDEYLIITGVQACLLRKGNGTFIDVELRTRKVGAVKNPFTTIAEVSVNAASSCSTVNLANDYIIIPRNSDVVLTAKASANNLEVTGQISGTLVKVVN